MPDPFPLLGVGSGNETTRADIQTDHLTPCECARVNHATILSVAVLVFYMSMDRWLELPVLVRT